MFITCREYLTGKLKQAGVRTVPITSMKRLKLWQEPHVGAVLFDAESYGKDGSKTVYKDTSQLTRKRRRIYKRDTTFSVIIGDPQPCEVERILSAFLESLDDGIYIDGNYVPVTAKEAEWVDAEDSILRSKVAVNIKIAFSGGVYRDTGFAPVNDVEIISISKGDD